MKKNIEPITVEDFNVIFVILTLITLVVVAKIVHVIFF